MFYLLIRLRHAVQTRLDTDAVAEKQKLSQPNISFPPNLFIMNILEYFRNATNTLYELNKRLQYWSTITRLERIAEMNIESEYCISSYVFSHFSFHSAHFVVTLETAYNRKSVSVHSRFNYKPIKYCKDIKQNTVAL
jgi:hypothetical protein